MPTTLHENQPSAVIGVVKVQKPMVFLRCSRNPLRGSAWSRCKNPWFFAISKVPARPSAGIGVVEVQKPMVFCDFQHMPARPSAGIGVVEAQKPMVFCDFQHARATLCGDRRGRGAKTHVFLRFLRCPRNPLRGSACSRCKNPWFFFAISAVLAQPSAGIGVVEVQKLSRLFATFVVRTGPGTGGSRVRFLPGPRAGVTRCNLHFKATCAEQLAQSKLHRATCADQLAPTSLRRAPCLEQLAQSNLRRATCAEQLAQSSLHRATCRERNLHRATCREPLAGTNLPEQLARSNLRGATCAEQLAQCNLRRATCADQLAPTSLRRAPCLVLSRACFTNASCRDAALGRPRLRCSAFGPTVVQ